jgi:hypothetical protein
MTDVRQQLSEAEQVQELMDGIPAAGAAATGRHGVPKGGSRGRRTAGSPGPVSRVAQVRLQADEFAELEKVMRLLHLSSTSEALREGIRLLVRDAAEIAAADDIGSYYGERPAPLPDGVIPASEEDLVAADAEKW